MTRSCVLVVDDEPDVLASMDDFLSISFDDVDIVCATNAQEALAIGHQREVNLLLTDFQMPGMNGLELVAAWTNLQPNCPKIICTAFPDPALEEQAMEHEGVSHFLAKPTDPLEMCMAISAALART